MPGVMWLLLGGMVFAAGMLIGSRLQEFYLAGRERRVAQQCREIAEQWASIEIARRNNVGPALSYLDRSPALIGQVVPMSGQ